MSPGQYPGGGEGRLETGAAMLGVLSTLRERWWIPAVAGLAVMLAALGMSLSRPTVYQSEAKVLFGAASLTAGALDVSQSIDPERDVATNIDIAKAGQVAAAVKEDLRLPESVDEIRSGLEVAAEGNSNILSFFYDDQDPQRAQRLAQSFVDQYKRFRAAAVRETAEPQIDRYEAQLRSLPTGAPERATIQDQLSRLRSLSVLASSDSQIIERASLPVDPISPNPVRDAILGLLVGLTLGSVLALILDLLDKRVKRVEDFEQLYGMRALASIPQVSFSARNQEERALGFEPYRVLRNAVGFVELTRALNVIMVTSAMPAEGKSTVSLNLARSIALSGQRVVLVECDLRRPSLARALGLQDSSGGLTTALVGRRPVAELLLPVSPGLAHLSLLPSGPLPPNAAELLRSPRMGTLLSELTADGTRVIIDAPPLLPVADAQGLLDHPQIDGALVVARAAQTTRDEVRRARTVFDQHRLQPMGIVVTGLHEERAYGYYGSSPGGVPRSEARASEEPERAVRR